MSIDYKNNTLKRFKYAEEIERKKKCKLLNRIQTKANVSPYANLLCR